METRRSYGCVVCVFTLFVVHPLLSSFSSKERNPVAPLRCNYLCQLGKRLAGGYDRDGSGWRGLRGLAAVVRMRRRSGIRREGGVRHLEMRGNRISWCSTPSAQQV